MANEKLKLTRTLGFEIECGTDTDYDDMSVINSECGYDGSVNCGYYSSEVKTDPIKDLNKLEAIYSDIQMYDMEVNDSCGLHIHVDNSDFSVEDTAKLLRFGAGIETLMYGLVESHRCDWNKSCHKHSERYYEYCRRMHYTWRRLFKSDFLDEEIPFNTFNHLNDLISWVNNKRNLRGGSNSRMWNGKYQWLNAMTPYTTVEFRIFHATTDYKEAQKFGMLAYQIVETVKNSTLSQLNFIIKSIFNSTTVEEMYSKLFDSIGLDQEFRVPVVNSEMENYLHETYCTPNQQAIAG